MISYTILCYICKKYFEVDEHSPQYQKIKRNMNARHVCPDCKARIERDARIVAM